MLILRVEAYSLSREKEGMTTDALVHLDLAGEILRSLLSETSRESGSVSVPALLDTSDDHSRRRPQSPCFSVIQTKFARHRQHRRLEAEVTHGVDSGYPSKETVLRRFFS